MQPTAKIPGSPPSQESSLPPVANEKAKATSIPQIVLTETVQTEEQQDHAKAQFEIFQNSPTAHVPPKKSVKVETTEEMTVDQKEKINAIQGSLIAEVGMSPMFFQGVQGMVCDPNNIPVVKKCLEDFEGKLSPENRALFNHITKIAIILLKETFKGAPFLGLPNVDDIMTVAIKRGLTDKIEACANTISAISPQYLKNLVAVAEQMPLIHRQGELVAQMKSLSKDDLPKLLEILLLDSAEEQENLVTTHFEEKCPALIRDIVDFLKTVADKKIRDPLVEGFIAAVTERTSEIEQSESRSQAAARNFYDGPQPPFSKQ